MFRTSRQIRLQNVPLFMKKKKKKTISHVKKIDNALTFKN